MNEPLPGTLGGKRRCAERGTRVRHHEATPEGYRHIIHGDFSMLGLLPKAKMESLMFVKGAQ